VVFRLECNGRLKKWDKDFSNAGFTILNFWKNKLSNIFYSLRVVKPTVNGEKNKIKNYLIKLGTFELMNKQ
jgi:hypothetical protein